MIFAAILAGGVGKRMQSGDLPKQFLMLGSKPIVVHTVEAFLSNNRIDKLYIGVPSVWCGYTENLIDKYINSAVRTLSSHRGAKTETAR